MIIYLCGVTYGRLIGSTCIGLIWMVQLICEESWTDGMTARQTHSRLIAMLGGLKSKKQKGVANKYSSGFNILVDLEEE